MWHALADGQDLPRWLKDFDQLGLAVLGKWVWPPVNDPSWQIDASISPQPGEVGVNKTSSGALHSTMVIVTGLTTDVCVGTTARDAADREFQDIVVELGGEAAVDHQFRAGHITGVV